MVSVLFDLLSSKKSNSATCCKSRNSSLKSSAKGIKDPQRRKLLRQEERKTFFYTLLKPAENYGCFDSPSNIFQRIFFNLHMGQCFFWKITGKIMATQNHLKQSDLGKSLDLIPPSYTPFVCDQIV